MQLKNRQKSIIAGGIGIVILGAGGFTAFRLSQNSITECPKEKIVDISANVPLTGDLAVYGESIRDGSTLALEELKKQDSSSACLAFDWQDNAGKPPSAVAILQKQFLQSPKIYISGLKPQTMAIKDQITAKGIPHFVWIFDPFINQNSRNNLRTYVNYKIEAPLYLKYAQARNAKRVAILYVNLPHPQEQFEKIVVPELKSMGVKDIFVEAYDIGTKDFKDIAVKTKNFKPDLIILNGFPFTLVGLVRSLRPLNLINDGNTIATFDMADTVGILGKDELEGIRVTTIPFITRPEQKKIADWSQRFTTRFGRSPRFTDAFSYDMTLVINDASKRLPQTAASSDQWIDVLRNTKTQGITGDLSFDKDGDLITPVEIGVFRGGKLIPNEKP